MANAKEIKRRIGSIKNTAQITKAMELISTVKMKKAQDEANNKKTFVSEMLKIFLNVQDNLSDYPLFQEGKWDKTLALVVGSNKGLCWGYNVNVFKKVNSYIQETGENLEYITVWKRAANFVARTGNKLHADFSENFTDSLEFSFAKGINEVIFEKFATGEYKKVVVFYQYYVNTITQLPVARKFIEISKEDILKYFKTILGDKYDEEVKLSEEERLNYTFEPSAEEFVTDFLPMILEMMLFDVLLQAKASEHSSRMVAMKAAKDNANKYASKLTLQYNKARQAAITAEVSEIVAGAESMKES